MELVAVQNGVPGTDVLAGESADSCGRFGNSSAEFLEYEDGIVVFGGIIDREEPIFWFRAPYFSGNVNDAGKWLGNADGD